jgi:hypothetical protein
MKRIFKYRLPRDGESITINAHVIKWLNIQEQHSWPHIWAIVDDARESNEWTIIAWGTGWDVPEELMTATYLGTAQDGAGYVWHYFGEIAAPSYATATTEYEYNPYDYTLTTKGCPIEPYSVTISCGDSDSAVSALKSNVYNDYTTSIDGLQGVVEYLTAAVASSNTATVRACT